MPSRSFGRCATGCAIAIAIAIGCEGKPSMPAPATVERNAAPARARDDAPDGVGAPAEVSDAPLDASVEADAPERPAWPLPDEVLTPWQTALIMMDPYALTIEQRRQRAFARRKQIMLNPDSTAKKVLDDLARAVQDGEIDPNAGKGEMIFTAKGQAPTGGPPPAGWRPPAGTDAKSPR